MRKFFAFLAVFAAAFMLSISVHADDVVKGDTFAITHHLDLWQVAADDGHVKAYDLSYHFTLFEYDRFNFVGAGLGLDVWSTCSKGSGCGADSPYRRYYGSPFIVVPVASIRLTKKSSDGSLSLGTNYVYQLRNKDHALTVGFMGTWQ